ncbi:MAG TPA: tetratricopeptide repeat protein [Xanthobacteraceae bacterium]|nr:tetratricopeptide repeat protein [Xanthobacteraceae bacterium]
MRACLRAALLLPMLALPWPAAAQQPVKGEVSATVENGFARIVITLNEDIESQVKAGNGIIVVTFKRPVDLVVERLNTNLAGIVSAARRDPDGRGIRIALARKVTVNSISAAERLFIDLLPEDWKGLPPGLPREVIEDLARRARDADQKVRQQRQLTRQNKLTPIRVRIATQPTFTRYVFELPELIGVSANNSKDKLTLTFDALLKFDLADAKAALPGVIGAVDTEIDQDSAVVRFIFAGKVDVRTFREDLSYIVDVTPMESLSERQERAVKPDELSATAMDLAARSKAPPASFDAPQTMPARSPADVAADAAPAPAPPPTPAPSTDAAMPAPPPAKDSMPKAAAKAEAAPPSPPVPAAAPATGADSGKALVRVALKRQGDNVNLTFPFAGLTPAAVFSRADTLWLVFDTPAEIVIDSLESDGTGTIKSAVVTRGDDSVVLRLKLERPRLVSAATDGPAWTITLGGEVLEPTRPVRISRNIIGSARSSITIPFDDARRLHRLADPEAGDALLVVTALGPARAFVKNQDFVEFRALAATHGVVVQPIADDLGAELAFDKIVISRPAGLVLSAAAVNGGMRALDATVYQPHVLHAQVWSLDRQADFNQRYSQLVRLAAEAPDAKRPMARADLARFYLARGMGVEAKAVLDVTLADSPPTAEDSTPLVLRAIASIMIGRLDGALKDLAHPLVGNQHDAPLWRAVIFARQGKWSEAREGFSAAGLAMGTLPLDVQRMMLTDIVRAAVEVGDIAGAVRQMREFEAVGVPRELEAQISVLSGRIAEGLGRKDDALRAYQAAADSWDRPVAAQGRLRELTLQYALGKLPRVEATAALEALTTTWRGDETEVEALHLLARLYAEEGRHRDAFHVMRIALAAHPNSDMTRRIHDEAAETFDSLFLAGKGDAMPAVGALSLFYDFRELTPIGRRGDEMIRRLADRLVSVDLLDQAAELLQHQVDHRLQGAARAQVATRLAVIYLMNRKPDRTLATLRATRTADITSELRTQRLLLEARALSDLGRNDVALEVIANIPGREKIRLRADILWASKRWREAAEEIELLYGDRWREFEPLAADERRDVLRAGIGFVLGEDPIGLGRLREKYAGKIANGPDRHAFDVITAPIEANGSEFREVARLIASIDTLDAFLRDLRSRFPETAAAATPPEPRTLLAAPARKADPVTTGSATRRNAAASSPLPSAPVAAVRPTPTRTTPR